MPILSFGEVFEDRSGGSVKLFQKNYLSQGKLPIIDQGKDYIAGYTNDLSARCQMELPLIIFGDHTRCIKFIDFPFAAGADGVKILKPKINANPRYLYYALRAIKLHNAGYDRHFKYLKRSSFNIPNEAEQNDIAGLLAKIENLLAKRREAIRLLGEYLKTSFHEMFESKNYPTEKIRNLVGETDVIDPTKEPTKKYKYIDIESINSKEGVITNPKEITGENAPSRARKLIKSGDVLVSTVRPNLNSTALVPSEFDNQVCSTGFAVLRSSKKICPQYLFLFSRTRNFISQLTARTKGASYPAVLVKDVLDVKIPSPPLTEQQRFSRMFLKVQSLKEKMMFSEIELQNLFGALMQKAFS